MATSKSYFANRASYRFFSNDPAAAAAAAAPHASTAFELDESDVIYGSHSPELRRPVRTSDSSSSSSSSSKRSSAAASKRGSDPGDRRGSAPSSSLPVNIPDWSKILRGEYRENRRRDSLGDSYYSDDDEDAACGGWGGGGRGGGVGEDGAARVPPHEFLARQMARTRIASSVHEGIGRTLKGRDLSRVRNAIWEKTGFED
ncbi:protein S40-4-like [Syzygium oleosum]|uniref:protein S40-4-like n=1 Tax=Syzygium oleosum TaxID=219896 RepID=UPI0011D1E363|nr:protein S40-4-like [Syzygium oleosum]